MAWCTPVMPSGYHNNNEPKARRHKGDAPVDHRRARWVWPRSCKGGGPATREQQQNSSLVPRRVSARRRHTKPCTVQPGRAQRRGAREALCVCSGEGDCAITAAGASPAPAPPPPTTPTPTPTPGAPVPSAQRAVHTDRSWLVVCGGGLLACGVLSFEGTKKVTDQG